MKSLLFALLLATSCANQAEYLRGLTAINTGCQGDVVIHDVKEADDVRSWSAVCIGDHAPAPYTCSDSADVVSGKRLECTASRF